MDLPTLVFANFVLMAFATLALALLARLYPHAAGMRAFLLATASLAAGAALVGVADPVRQGAALALANGLLVLGLACLNWAMAAYWRWPEPRMAAHLAAIGAMVLLYGAFTGGANNLGARAVIVGTAMGVELALGAWRFARARAQPAAVAMALFAAFNFVRGPATWLTAGQPRRQHWVLVATDYGFLLFGAVMALVLAWMVILELRARLDRLAVTDELTGLANRRGLEREAERRLARMTRAAGNSPAGALLVMDLDRFKQINDDYGHAAGDEALRTVARLLRARLRAEDLAARLGGEEFVVLLPRPDLDAAAGLAERLREELQQLPLGLPGAPPPLTASWGVAAHLPGESWARWLQRADLALYAAKQAGRNCVRTALRECAAAPPQSVAQR